jgi:hypothetical protein
VHALEDGLSFDSQSFEPAETTPVPVNTCAGLSERLRRSFPARPRGPPEGATASVDMAAFLRVRLVTRRIHRLDSCPTADLAGRERGYPLRADSNQPSQTLRVLDNLSSTCVAEAYATFDEYRKRLCVLT